jgi:MFS superfamily sulfate permease-like transporter
VTTVDDDTSSSATSAGPPVDRDAVARDVVVVLVAFLVAGVAVGLVWPQVVQPVTVTKSDFGLQTGEVALAHRFDHDAWYSLLGGGAALLLGVLLTLWRRTHETATLVAVLLGAVLAAWVSSVTGSQTGPEAAEVVLADAELGATAPDQVLVTADAAYLAWPLAAVLGAVVVLWAPSARDRAREHRVEE